jgi:uncharacterized protein with HEPN domain
MQRDPGYLYDMLHEARMVLEFTSGKSFEAFCGDMQCQYAVIRAIEIIGEAAGQVSDEFRQTHPELPWRQTIGMRNRLIHGYGDIVLSIVWEVIEKHIPEMIDILEPLVPSNP